MSFLTLRPAAKAAMALLACTAFLDAQEQEGDRYQGQPTEYWVELLQQGDLGGRRKAVYALWHLADPKAAVPLAGALESGNEYVRSTASKALAKLGEGAQAALAKIAELVNHEREAVRREAATLCYRLGPLAARIVDPLTRALASKDPWAAARLKR